MYFEYGLDEIIYLKSKDEKLAAAMEQIGPVRRKLDPDLFSSVVHHIIGQQISTKAQATVWSRMRGLVGNISAESIGTHGTEELQQLGMTFRKAEYIRDFADKVNCDTFDFEALKRMDDAEARKELVKLKGIGEWTAEMILLFCLQRPNIFSYGDLAIHRGLRMLYHHREVKRELFEKYRRRYAPCGSVASLYLWAIAGGAIEGMRDYAPKNK